MKQPLPVLEVDLLIEHKGRQLNLRGSGTSYVASFPTLLSLMHHARVLWRFRKSVPRGVSLTAKWRKLRIVVKSPPE